MTVQTVQPSYPFGHGPSSHDAAQVALRSNSQYTHSTLSHETSFASTQSSNDFVHVEPPSRTSSRDSAPVSHRPYLARAHSATASGQPRAFSPIQEANGTPSDSKDEKQSFASEVGWHMRHGWDYSAEELRDLSSVRPVAPQWPVG